MQDVTANPSKKPVASVGLSTAKLFLFKGIESKLEQIENAPDPNVKKQWKDYELLRLWTRRYKQAGESPWWAIGFAIGCASLLIFVVATRWPKSYFYAYPTDYLRIVQKLNESDFMVQRVDHGLAQEQTMMRFCSDYLPWFEAGHTLEWIRYDDHKSCQSVGPEDRGFDILRDANGMPVLPPNCRFDQVNNHIVCEGGKPRFD